MLRNRLLTIFLCCSLLFAGISHRVRAMVAALPYVAGSGVALLVEAAATVVTVYATMNTEHKQQVARECQEIMERYAPHQHAHDAAAVTQSAPCTTVESSAVELVRDGCAAQHAAELSSSQHPSFSASRIRSAYAMVPSYPAVEKSPLHVSITPRQLTSFASLCEQRCERERLEHVRVVQQLQTDEHAQRLFVQQLNEVSCRLMACNDRGYPERVKARLELENLVLSYPYDSALHDVRETLHARYFSHDGELIACDPDPHLPELVIALWAQIVDEKKLRDVVRNAAQLDPAYQRYINQAKTFYPKQRGGLRGLLCDMGEAVWSDIKQVATLGRSKKVASSQLITNNEHNRKIQRVIELCEHGQFDKAEQICSQSRCSHIKNIYHTMYRRVYDAHGIRVRYQHDPKWAQLSRAERRSAAATRAQQQVLNEFFELRYQQACSMVHTKRLGDSANAGVLQKGYALFDEQLQADPALPTNALAGGLVVYADKQSDKGKPPIVIDNEEKEQRGGGAPDPDDDKKERVLKAAYGYATHENQQNHFFGEKNIEKHKLQPVVDQMGSQGNVVKSVLKELVRSGNLPSEGRFERVVTLGNFAIHVRGAVHEGIPKLGTMFIK